jgi:hypothetical protein
MPTKRLTDQFVERVSSPSRGRVEYFDAAFPALSLRVSEHGHKSWSIFYRVNGNPKLRRYKLGIYPHIKPAKARLLATEVLDQVRGGIDGALRRQARQDVVPDIGTIDALVRDYLRQHVEANCSAGTYRITRRMLEVDVLKPWRGRTLASITKRDVIALVDRIAERAPVHANRVLARINATFAWAVDKDRVPVSPSKGVKPPTKEKSRDRWLNDQENRLVLEGLRPARLSVRWVVQDLAVDRTALRRNRVNGMERARLRSQALGDTAGQGQI